LGNFDASLRWGARSAYAELKCGPNEAAMEACAWDALKCAFALRHGFGEAMFLLACAPQPLWQQSARGCELFAGGEWQAADLRARYAPGFTKWERDGYKPVRVPTRLRTVPGARVPVNVNGAPWLLALARVEPIGDLQRDRYDWPPLMTKGRALRSRPGCAGQPAVGQGMAPWLFATVTRYHPGRDRTPGENTLTQVTGAVLRRVPARWRTPSPFNLRAPL
jgi:hypothetical protein